jgi:hypothetical protein
VTADSTIQGWSDFNPRQRATVRAALRFWVSAVETSRVHPSRHPEAAKELLEHGYIGVDEIELLLDATVEGPPYLMIADIAKILGCGVTAARRVMRGVSPDMIVRQAYLWKRERVLVQLGKTKRRGRRGTRR